MCIEVETQRAASPKVPGAAAVGGDAARRVSTLAARIVALIAPNCEFYEYSFRSRSRYHRGSQPGL
jgi:hypothetical protein